jgi:hypothetical protein
MSKLPAFWNLFDILIPVLDWAILYNSGKNETIPPRKPAENNISPAHNPGIM